ncbi:uncharacterized protein LOC106706709 [Latimeria chalumnae]|uniref:uncharacterized protein LOC106706709 n=1 Tax=Latimeria chalumnae TaxID=7897 RepID=UPI00313B7956
MQIHQLCLLILLCAAVSEQVDINNEVLKKVVADFVTVATWSGKKLNQYSFLIGMSKSKCEDANLLRTYTFNGVTKEKPEIFGNLEKFDMSKEANYVAVTPDLETQTTGKKRCSEYKILYDNIPGGSGTVATWLGEKLKQELQGGGCVIFFNTNTPCTGKCFNLEKNDCRIDIPLGEKPFSEWNTNDNNRPVHTYFVYSEVFDKDVTNNNLPKITDGFGHIANLRFQIERCQAQNTHLCSSCKEDGLKCLDCAKVPNACGECLKKRDKRCMQCIENKKLSCSSCTQTIENCSKCIKKPGGIKNCNSCRDIKNKCLDCFRTRRQLCPECQPGELQCENCLNLSLSCFNCSEKQHQCDVCMQERLTCQACSSDNSYCMQKERK